MLRFFYRTKPGRLLLRPLVGKPFSDVAGRFMDSAPSRHLIRPFIKGNHIDMADYEETTYENFNQFFTRQVRPDARPLPSDPNTFTAPCDGLLSCYPITDDLVIPVKQSQFSIKNLLLDPDLAKEFNGGTCLVFRLCVDHYHRYRYIDDGTKSKNYHIRGLYHTVRPIALEQLPVFTENTREYTVLNTDHFGRLIQVEVGAMLVGRIQNYHEAGPFHRGDEKGRFLYGGSTIILLIKPGAIDFEPPLQAQLEAQHTDGAATVDAQRGAGTDSTDGAATADAQGESGNNLSITEFPMAEIPVRMGQPLGYAKK